MNLFKGGVFEALVRTARTGVIVACQSMIPVEDLVIMNGSGCYQAPMEGSAAPGTLLHSLPTTVPDARSPLRRFPPNCTRHMNLGDGVMCGLTWVRTHLASFMETEEGVVLMWLWFVADGHGLCTQRTDNRAAFFERVKHNTAD